MNLPEIDIDNVPALETQTGVYGSMSGGGHSDDRVIAVMVYLYTAKIDGFGDV